MVNEFLFFVPFFFPLSEVSHPTCVLHFLIRRPTAVVEPEIEAPTKYGDPLSIPLSNLQGKEIPMSPSGRRPSRS